MSCFLDEFGSQFGVQAIAAVAHGCSVDFCLDQSMKRDEWW
jgi:hypothetical protein